MYAIQYVDRGLYYVMSYNKSNFEVTDDIFNAITFETREKAQKLLDDLDFGSFRIIEIIFDE